MAVKPCQHAVTGKLRILAIDDDQINLMVMESLLKPQGFEVAPASDSTEAYAVVDGCDTWPDIVFLDYNLEYGDSGETVLVKLLDKFGAAPIPIIMCTAMSAGSSVLDKCLEMGAADVLLKPYERVKVLEMLEKHCGSKAQPAPKAAPQPAPAPAAASAPAPAPAVAAPAPAPVQPSPAAAQPASNGVEQLCVSLGLEYVGKKLVEAGISIPVLKTMDDTALRKAGVVVKAQRDKLLDAVKSM